MAKENEEPTDIERLHEWISGVGGNITLDAARLEAVEASKSGNRLTIVLKKPKPSKAAEGRDN